jgi:ribokinase
METCKRDVLAFGSIVIDNVLLVKRFASINETVIADDFRYTLGGAGANVAVAVARLGGKSGLFAVSGYDFEKISYKKALVEQGVDIRGVIRTKSFPMPRSFIISVKDKDDQVLYYYENRRESAKLLFENIELAKKLCREYKIIHFSTGHFDFYWTLLESLEDYEGIVSFDPGQETFTYPHKVVKLIKKCDFLFMNIHEAKKIKEFLKLRSLRELEGPKLICVSMGARGSLIFTEKEVIRIPSVKPDKLEDPTGAGDSHRAGFLFAILKGYDIKTAGRIASTVASFTIEAPGAQTSLPNWEKVKERYEKFFKEKLE